jgi:serine/threonine protein kinase
MEENDINEGPPDENFAKKMVQFDLKKEDPSKYYDIIERIGVGGFAKVFKVKRKIDNVICALKFVEPKN